MRGEPADGTAEGVVTRGPSRLPVPSLDQDVVTGPAVEVVLPQPADQDVVAVQGVDGKPVKARLGQGDVHLGGQPENGGAERLAGDTDGLIAVGAVADDGLSLKVGPTRAERTWSFSPRITG